MTPYNKTFKSKMVQRMSGARAVSATSLGEATGVPQATLSRWLLAAGTLGPVKKKKQGARTGGSARSVQEKMRLSVAAFALEGEERGAFLRREGVHEAELAEWRAMLEAALDGAPLRAAARDRADDRREIQDLRRELNRKDKALAETAALLVLQKKVRAIWGDGDDDTDKGTGK